MKYFSTQKSGSTFTWASPEVLSVTGFDCNEVVGINPYDHINADDIQVVVKKHMKGLGVMDDSKVQDLKYRWRHKDGNYIWCQVYFTKYKDGLICLTRKMKWYEIIWFRIFHT